MANSKYAYVRHFEQSDSILPNTWIVVRVDGRAFHRFSSVHEFTKPNDMRALRLINEAARATFRDMQDVVLAYGQSDEFSFVLAPHSTLFDRRTSKLTSTIVSTFTAYYILFWPGLFPDTLLVTPRLGRKASMDLARLSSAPKPPYEDETRDAADDRSRHDIEAVGEDSELELLGTVPNFDARAVAYPSTKNLRDYLSWRQADCHINNLFNTTFWALVQQGGLSERDAEQALQGTLAADKNEILFSRFGINYNNEPAMFRKGSVLFRDYGPNFKTPTDASRDEPETEKVSDKTHKKRQADPKSKTQREKERKRKAKAQIVVQHVDIIEDQFWDAHPWLLDLG